MSIEQYNYLRALKNKDIRIINLKTNEEIEVINMFKFAGYMIDETTGQYGEFIQDGKRYKTIKQYIQGLNNRYAYCVYDEDNNLILTLGTIKELTRIILNYFSFKNAIKKQKPFCLTNPFALPVNNIIENKGI